MAWTCTIGMEKGMKCKQMPEMQCCWKKKERKAKDDWEKKCRGRFKDME